MPTTSKFVTLRSRIVNKCG